MNGAQRAHLGGVEGTSEDEITGLVADRHSSHPRCEHRSEGPEHLPSREALLQAKQGKGLPVGDVIVSGQGQTAGWKGAWPSRWGDPGVRDRRWRGLQAEGKRQNKETRVSEKGDFAQDKDFCPVLGLYSDTNFAEVLLNGEVSLFSLTFIGLPRCCIGKESSCQCRRHQRGRCDSWVSSRRSPVGGNGNQLQCSCLGNPMDRGTWWATVPGVAKESGKT